VHNLLVDLTIPQHVAIRPNGIALGFGHHAFYCRMSVSLFDLVGAVASSHR
jgi:hypothetical protein